MEIIRFPGRRHADTLSATPSGHAARSAAAAVELMFSAAGTSSTYASNRLDRCFRDVRTMNQHFGVGLQRPAAAGEFLLQAYAPRASSPQ